MNIAPAIPTKLPTAGFGQRRALLLDFDGVILKHPAANAIINKSVNRFVIKHNGYDNGVHEKLFTRFGHTLIGLQKRGLNISISEFNKEVFNDKLFKDVKELQLPYDTYHTTNTIRTLVNYVRRRNVKVCIFSNAPRNWIEVMLSATGLKPLFKKSEILVGEEFDLLKPNPLFYDIVEAQMNCNITFVDDSLINIEKAPEHWSRFHYVDSFIPNSYELNGDCKFRAIRDLSALMEYFD